MLFMTLRDVEKYQVLQAKRYMNESLELIQKLGLPLRLVYSMFLDIIGLSSWVLIVQPLLISFAGPASSSMSRVA